MLLNVYSIKDELVGFSNLACATSDELAKRDFITSLYRYYRDTLKGDLRGSGVLDNILYIIGTFDTEKGRLESCEPKIIITTKEAFEELGIYENKGDD